MPATSVELTPVKQKGESREEKTNQTFLNPLSQLQPSFTPQTFIGKVTLPLVLPQDCPHSHLPSSTHGRVGKATRKVTEYAEAALTVQSQKEQQAAWKFTRLWKEAGRIQ